MSVPYINGVPALGLGTYKIQEDSNCYGIVRKAIELGYRLIDTAEVCKFEKNAFFSVADL